MANSCSSGEVSSFKFQVSSRNNVRAVCSGRNINFEAVLNWKLETGNLKLFSQLFDRNLVIGIDADFAGNLHGFFGDLPRRQLRVLEQRRGGGGGERPTTANGGDAGIGLDHVALSADEKRLRLVGDQQQGFERAQHFVGTPVLGQFNRRAAKVAVV